jgi:hypothetical protein
MASFDFPNVERAMENLRPNHGPGQKGAHSGLKHDGK